MITFRCDRCGADVSPEKLYLVTLIFTPYDVDDGLDVDKEDRHDVGQVCAACSDVVEPLIRAMVQPPRVDAVREDVAAPIVPIRDQTASSYSREEFERDSKGQTGDDLVSWGDKREKSE
jgi:hypothetical protein